MNTVLYSKPIDAELHNAYRDFLISRGLRDEEDWNVVCIITDDEGKIVATGAGAGKVIKQIAVSPAHEGENLCASVMSELISEAYSKGVSHLLLCTKPKYKSQFAAMGFFALAETNEALLMENRKNGLEEYLSSLPCPKGASGAVVCNCDPFTFGHRYLIERASTMCDWLHIFVLSEPGAMFSCEQRFTMVKNGVSGIKKCFVHRSEEYLISRATFPTYFIKDKKRTEEIQADLDIVLFGEKIAPELGIIKRFVGTEPNCCVTSAYNRRLKKLLPKYGIELIETERLKGISASKVRELIRTKRLEESKTMVPETTYEEILRFVK